MSKAAAAMMIESLWDIPSFPSLVVIYSDRPTYEHTESFYDPRKASWAILSFIPFTHR